MSGPRDKDQKSIFDYTTQPEPGWNARGARYHLADWTRYSLSMSIGFLVCKQDILKPEGRVGCEHQEDSVKMPNKCELRASLVAQWLRIRLPMQETQVQALVQEDPTCHGATKPMRHNY